MYMFVSLHPFLGEGEGGVSHSNCFIHLCCLVLVPDIERHATLLFYRHIDFLYSMFTLALLSLWDNIYRRKLFKMRDLLLNLCILNYNLIT